MAFAYFVVFPLVFGFLTGVAPEGVAVMTDISRYLDFVLKMFFAFGIAFEVPIATILLVWSGMVTAEKLAAKRPYIIVGAFVFGMLLTPPDVISQTLLALPMWLLFELGLIFSRWYVKKPLNADDEEENQIGGESMATAAAAGGSVAPAHDQDPASEQAEETSPWPEDDSNDSGHEEYEPMSEDEMDAELDRIEAEEASDADGAGEESEQDSSQGEDKDDKPRA
jgi:sec-independent protein translocase protein TatC